MTATLMKALGTAVTNATLGNSFASVPGAAILWTDKDRQWEKTVFQLQQFLPQLIVLGDYCPSQRTGPAIWLKCVIAATLPQTETKATPNTSNTPIVYLPGFSRSDLRAIEECPRELQPLAELQYRGGFWSQANGKDWSVNAFLTSKNGGLGLEIAQDRNTQAALLRALNSGVLLNLNLAQMNKVQINSAWLDLLLAPNPIRDILVWLNDPLLAKQQWDGGRWDVFCNRCKNDYGFDPHSDGVLVAVEKLAGRKNAWLAVWEHFQESYTSFTKVTELLGQLQPPTINDLFSDANSLASYPRANEVAEQGLRSSLLACNEMNPSQARMTITEAEAEHAHRRKWLWASLNQSPLAKALEHLALLAKQTEQSLVANSVEDMATKYKHSGWLVDIAALNALAMVQSKADTDVVSAAIRAIYLPWLENSANHFQSLVQAQAGLHTNPPKATSPVEGLCTVFVDGLRYDVAMLLKDYLKSIGEAVVTSAWTCIPSVTASGKAWASPVAYAIAGTANDQDFQPCVANDAKPLTIHNFRKLLEDQGWQVLKKNETGDITGKAWVECGDLDHYGHEHGIRLARDINGQLQQIVERLTELKEAGWTKFKIVTDHGWLLLPGGLPKTELSKSQTQTRWGRCAILKETAKATSLTFNWDWCQEVQIAMAPGISSFIAGAEYSHGGLTLQECLVPVIDLVAKNVQNNLVKVKIQKVKWQGLLCKIELSPADNNLRVDIRTKAALESSSLVAKVKSLENGKVSLAIDDDSHTGTAAFIVVLDKNGNVLQKLATTIGEQ